MGLRPRENQEGAEVPVRYVTPGWGGPPPDELDEVVLKNLDLWMRETERSKTRLGRLTNATLRLVGLGSVGLVPGRLGGRFAALVHTEQTPRSADQLPSLDQNSDEISLEK